MVLLTKLALRIDMYALRSGLVVDSFGGCGADCFSDKSAVMS